MAIGGAQKVLLELANWLHLRGYPVTAAFFYDRDQLARQWQEVYPFRVVALGNWKKDSPATLKTVWLLQSLFRLFRLMKMEHYSAALAFTHHSSLLALPLAWLAGIPVRISSHRGRILGIPRWQEKLHALVVNIGIATKLAAVSSEVRKQAIEEGVRPDKIVVIPNGVQVAAPAPAEIARIRREAGVDGGGFLILSAGRLWEEKGHIHLVRAMPAVLRGAPKAALALAGDGAERRALEIEAGRLNVANHIRFLGVRGDVNAWMAAADVFVLPSNSEGMPNALLEAMGLGAAVVATAVGGVLDLIRDGANGCLVPARDPDALAFAILSLYRSPEERRRLGENAREMVRREYRMEAMCERYRLLLFPVRSGAGDD